MKIAVKKSIKIKDGIHVGVITNIRYRHKPFEYTDLVIEFKSQNQLIKIKAGYPTMITKSTSLGRLLERFGEELIPGVGIDPDEILIGKKIQFETKTETNSRGSFANVVTESVKPVQEKIK